MSRRVIVALVAGVASGLVPAVGEAQEGAPPTAAAAAPVEARDLVRMKDGGMMRGRIDELVPGEYVVITLPSGASRRVEMKDVEYAGPDPALSSQAPPPAPPPTAAPPPAPPPTAAPPPAPGAVGHQGPAVVKTQRSPVKLTSPQGGLTFHLRTQTSTGMVVGSGWSPKGGFGTFSGTVVGESYEQLCTAPCDVELAHSVHQLAVSPPGGRPIPADEAVRITGPATLRGEVESYSGTRAAGWIVLIGGTAAGLVTMLTARTEECEPLTYSDSEFCSTTIDFSQFFVGTGIAVASGVVGVLLALKKDEAHVTVTPGVQALLPARRIALERAPLDGLQGITLRATF